MTKFSVTVIGCRFNHPFGERVLCMWRYLAKKYDIQVHIITTDRWIDAKGDSELKDSKNLKIHKLFTVGAKYGQFKHAMPGLLMKICEIDPDIIYAQEEPIQMGVAYPSALIAKALNKPFMFFTWENIYQEWFFPISKVEKFCCDAAGLILAGTEDAKQVLLKKGVPEHKITVLPETGIDTNRFRPKRNRKINRTVLYVGRLVPEKGVNLILKARQILKKKGYHLKYLFIGTGPLKTKLKRLSEKSKDIVLLDPVPYEKIPQIYHKGDVLVYASLKTKKWIEQYGYSMLEALASGVPVISSKVSGPKAIIKQWENGILIDVGNYKGLAAELAYLYIFPRKIKILSGNARKDAVKRLSKQAVAKRTFEALEDLYKQWIYN